MSTWIMRRTEVQYTDPMPQFIYTMKGLGKVHPPDAKVLEDIWLSFYFGAKIGVLGLNGAGKSSLLKIMAGQENPFFPPQAHTQRLLARVPPPRPPPASAHKHHRARAGA